MLENDSTSVYVASWQGKFEEAIVLYKKAMAIDLKIHGPDHPALAIRYNNLADAYGKQASARGGASQVRPGILARRT